MVLFIYFIGKAWSILLPRGDKIAARWRLNNPDKARLPLYVTLIKFINPHSFGLKEHAIASITASSASQGSLSVVTFTVQRLFYEGNPLNAATVILGILSISLFGYGLTGLLRPVTVWGKPSSLAPQAYAHTLSTRSGLLDQHPARHHPAESPLGRLPFLEADPVLLVLFWRYDGVPDPTGLYHSLAQLGLDSLSRISEGYGQQSGYTHKLVRRESQQRGFGHSQFLVRPDHHIDGA